MGNVVASKGDKEKKRRRKSKRQRKRKRQREGERKKKKGRESGQSDCTAVRAQLSVECVGLIAQFHVRRIALHIDHEAMLQRDCCMLEMGCLDVCLAPASVGLFFLVVE